MVKMIVPEKEDIVTKWVEETARRATYYGRETPKAAERWEERARGAGPTYKSAITAPDIEKRFVGGIKRVGAAKFRRKVTAVGVARFGPGVTAASEDYDVGFGPYVDVLKVIDVPARKPRGDPANIDRVRGIAAELNKKRLALLAAGM